MKETSNVTPAHDNTGLKGLHRFLIQPSAQNRYNLRMRRHRPGLHLDECQIAPRMEAPQLPSAPAPGVNHPRWHHFSLASTPYLAASCARSLLPGKGPAPPLLEVPLTSSDPLCQCRHRLCTVAICPTLLLGYFYSETVEVVKGAGCSSSSNVDMPDEPPSEAPGMSRVLEGSSFD